MLPKMTVAVEITAADERKSVVDALKTLPEVEITQWFNGAGEKGEIAVKAHPGVIVIDDQPETSHSASQRVMRLRQAFPQAAIFVVSGDTRPEHIVEMMKSGVAQYLLSPLNAKVLTAAVEEVQLRLGSSGKQTSGAVYSFISSKGGLGATVIAVNTAAAMMKNRKATVTLLDMSLQSGDASVLLDLVAPTTISDLCQNIHRLDVGLLRSAMSRHRCGLDFLPAPGNPEDSEDVTAMHVTQILKLTRQLYDQVIIDCASMRVDDRTMEIFKQSDKICVVTDLSVPAVRNAARLCLLIEKMGIDRRKIEVVVNRFIKGSALSIEEVEKTLKKPVYWLFPNDFSEIVSSINQGEPLVLRQPGSPFAKNTLEFIDKLTNPRSDGNYRGIRGAFGKAI